MKKGGLRNLPVKGGESWCQRARSCPISSRANIHECTGEACREKQFGRDAVDSTANKLR